ncbi:hypothetical protein ACHHYP_03379 [Achlya hypogyna]|uniref:Uncharacterized protein n=1 Tax=Achlya hypogyna TaxID=1202772 RepID=A0A1V9Z3Y9_ACHHY|nr:hypothetical protein ACHHYP_03379 [Achlya hypogyna]
MAASVLSDRDLLLLIAEYQHGLPFDVREVLVIAAQVVICPRYRTPHDFMVELSNFPLLYADLEYIRRNTSSSGNVNNFALCLLNNDVAVGLPLHLAIVAGNLKHVRRLAAWQPAWVSTGAVSLAAKCGQLRILEHLATLPNGAPTKDTMITAAANGYLDVVQWLHALPGGPGCTAEAMDCAAAYGHLDVVAFLHEHRSEGCTAQALLYAIRNGHASVVDYLLTKWGELVRTRSSYYFMLGFHGFETHRHAPNRNHLRTLQVLKAHNVFPHFDPWVVRDVISRRSLEELQFVCDWGAWRIDNGALEAVIKAKDPVCIDYALRRVLIDDHRWPLHDLGDDDCLWDLQEELPWAPWIPTNGNMKTWAVGFKAMDVAACLGDLPTVKLLHRLRLNCCSAKAMDHACARGHLDVAKWLHAHRLEGCTPDAMVLAAVGGHLSVVQWLHTVRRVPCSEDALVAAADRGDVAMLTYLATLPLPNGKVKGGQGWEQAVFLSDGSRVEYFSGGLAVDVAAIRGRLNLAKLLHRHRASTAAVDMAVSNDDVKVVQYLLAHRREGCAESTFREAMYRHSDILLELLATHCAPVVTDRRQLYTVAARRGSVAQMEILWRLLPIEMTPEFTRQLVATAAAERKLDLLQWLIETKEFMWTPEVLEHALHRGHKRVVECLTRIGQRTPETLTHEA